MGPQKGQRVGDRSCIPWIGSNAAAVKIGSNAIHSYSYFHQQKFQAQYNYWKNSLQFEGESIGCILHGPSMFAVKAKIYGVIYNQFSSMAFDETSSYWSAPKSS